jgi:hypothetical protein
LNEMNPVENFFDQIKESETQPFFKSRLEEKLKRINSASGQTWLQDFDLDFKPALLISLVFIFNLLVLFNLEKVPESPKPDFAEEFGFFQNMKEEIIWYD